MSTLKQIEANRLNAKKSTGPRTAEGKAAVRLNALKHGLFALDPIIEGEKPAHFDALRTSHYERFNPATPEEHVLLAAMVRDAWSLERFSNAETDMWGEAIDRESKYPHPLGASQMYLARSLSLVQRRVDSAQRNYRRNLELLIKLQAARQKAAPAAQPIPQPKPDETTGALASLTPAIGSVPANPKTPPSTSPTVPLLCPKPLPEPPPKAA